MASVTLADRLWFELVWSAQLWARDGGALRGAAARAQERLLARNRDLAQSPPAPLPLDEIDAADFDPIHFAREHVCRRPVVIRGAMRGAPLFDRWSLRRFREAYGDLEVLVHERAQRGERLNGRGIVACRLSSFIDGLLDGSDGRYMVASTALFAHDRDLIDDIPLQRLVDRFGVRVTRAELFMGNQNHWSPYHSAWNENFFVQVEGRKRWKFVDPALSAFMYPDYQYAGGPNAVQTALDPQSPEAYPLAALPQQYEVVLEPGDLLYNPPYWWHEVENLGPGIGMPLRVQPRRNLRSPFLFVSKMQILSGLRDGLWRKIYREIAADRLWRRDLKRSTMNDDPLRVSYAADPAVR